VSEDHVYPRPTLASLRVGAPVCGEGAPLPSTPFPQAGVFNQAARPEDLKDRGEDERRPSTPSRGAQSSRPLTRRCKRAA
jgi:hypothetical protein